MSHSYQDLRRRLAGGLLMAALVLAMSMISLYYDHVFATRGIVADGEVVKVGSPKGPYTVRFTTRTGETVVSVPVTGVSRDKKVGDHVRIVYDPRHPSSVQEDDGGYYIWPAVFGAFGICIAGAAVWIHRRAGRRFPGWRPLSVAEVAELLSGWGRPWWVAGGQAIELAVGRPLREHHDIGVLMLRRDHMLIHQALPGWECWMAGEGLSRWPGGQRLSLFVDELWCRPGANQPWRLKIILAEASDADWLPHRGARIRRTIASLGRLNESGIPYLAPEVALRYQAKKPRPQDDLDFAAVLPLLNTDQRRWLDDALAETYGHGHPRRSRVRS
jgi:hypothetical protein